ncbi:hypothetical protein NL108_013632 [Boleophthalmus pectinirostris]|nr:hypothetical protein NL108_013632 [Boleophthalmus pectinirostris]
MFLCEATVSLRFTAKMEIERNRNRKETSAVSTCPPSPLTLQSPHSPSVHSVSGGRKVQGCFLVPALRPCTLYICYDLFKKNIKTFMCSELKMSFLTLTEKSLNVVITVTKILNWDTPGLGCLV